MPSYHYKAVRMDGEAVEGQMEAHDEGAVIRQLQKEGLIPLSARRAGGPVSYTHLTLPTSDLV